MADTNKKKTGKDAVPEKSLEQSMQELADIVARMEKGGMPLEETFGLYKEGMDLLKQCRSAIDRVEKELEILEDSGEDDEDGE
ncbi:MAG: exodeoxyribonuclease VII small subunit [Lachnospiraceae bacterium]|nr:exodeoxyribonuclease VII small subunit [Lachnospiraceae bacterium]